MNRPLGTKPICLFWPIFVHQRVLLLRVLLSAPAIPTR